jgi:rubrerythrin
MAGLGEIKSEQNVLNAFQSESRLREAYKSFAEIAEKEGRARTAKLFHATAASQDIIAHMLLRSLHETGHATSELWAAGTFDTRKVNESSRENLKVALEETRAVMEMYPQMIKDTEKDGMVWDLAKEFFGYADAVQKVHIKLFENELENIDTKTERDIYVCESCGNTVENMPSETCQVCGSSKSAFKMIH